MKIVEIQLPDVQQTERFGILLGEVAAEGDVICLDGDLGAGKTTLTQAIGAGMQVPAEYYITSPSFAILHEHPGRIPLFHMDFYRLTGSEDIAASGFDEFFYKNGTVVVEWANKAVDIYPDDTLFIDLSVNEDESRTALCRYSSQSSWCKRLPAVLQKLLT